MFDRMRSNPFAWRMLVAAATGALAASLIAGAPSAAAAPSPTAQAPTAADFTYDCVPDIIMWTCSFNGSSSSGAIVTWDWQFPGAAFKDTGSGVTATARYVVERTYDVTLTVTDDAGQTDTITEPVIVG